MKKLFFLGIAALGFAACVQEQVVDTPMGGAITFESAFVDNATRAAVDPSTTTGTLTAFDVWGFVKEYDGTVFVDQDVTLNGGNWGYEGAQFWAPNQPYYFAALAPMNSETLGHELATGDAAKLGLGTLTFTNVNGTEDVLYATSKVTSKGVNQPNDPVKFQFRHLLSKVKFTFKNGFVTNNASIKVTNIKMTAPAKASINVAQANYAKAWSLENQSVTLAFGDVETLTYGQNAESADERLTIPASSTYEYNVTFDVELFMGAQSVYTVSKTSKVTGVELEMGKAYNFTAEINPENLELDVIKFDVIEVEDWENAADVPAHVGTTAYVSDATEFAAAIADPEVAAVVLNNNIEIDGTLTRAGEEGTVISKSFVLDGNGKTLSYAGSGRIIDIKSDVANETYKNVTIKNVTLNYTGSYLERGINYNANGRLVLDGVKFTGKAPSYAVNFPGSADNAQVTIKNCELTGLIALNVWGEDMVINVENSVLTSVDNAEAENYSAVKLNNDGSTSAEGTVVNFKNSTVVATDEKGEPSYAFYNATETGEIFADETNEVIGADNKVQVAIVYFESNPNQFYGCTTLADAIASMVKHNGTGIRITKDIELDEPVAVAKDQTIVIDLNGKTISAVDNTTKNYELIKNAGNLTIFGGGKMTVKATVNSGWNRYSAVIANTVGGNLTVKDVEIEHLGGTDMAYGIDNLTNGKGTSAVTTIEGATVKSPYRAVRQFLNGTEATNELYVKAGSVLEGTNKSIFFHDPSKNANTGKLIVEAGAQLKGDVYLYVTEGSTEWPVEVSIAESALVGESTVVSGNVPTGYMVTNKDGNWTVVTVTTVADTDELSDAILEAADKATIVLTEGTFNMPSIGGKDITLVGTENTIINTGTVGLDGGNLTLEGVTVKAGTYQGFQHSNVVTYNNVTIQGEMFCYGKKDIFNNCTFVLDNQYVWAYASDNIEFNNCVFETNGKAILIYNEGDGATNVTVKNCTFNATAGAKAGAIANQNCAAIEIDNTGGLAHNITTSGNTVNANFSGEWRIKNFVAGNAITVNGTEYTQIAVDGKLMTIDANRNVTVLE